MLVLGEDEGGAGYLGGPVGVGGDVLEGCPPLGEQGESSLSAAAQAAQQRIPGAGAGVEFLVAGGLFHGDEDADSGALVGAVGQGRHSEGGGAVEGGQGVEAGGGDVVDRSGLGGPGPGILGRQIRLVVGSICQGNRTRCAAVSLVPGWAKN